MIGGVPTGGVRPAPRPVLVLASGSPRRRELLDHLGVRFEVRAPAVDESPHPGEAARAYVARLAAEKAEAVARPSELVLAADTTVELDGHLLGKPHTPAEAARMLWALSGRRHAVHTGVVLRLDARVAATVVSTGVVFVTLSADDVAWYVATGEPLDKAGGYAVQGAGGLFVAELHGSPSNVVGLPLHVLPSLAADLGVGWPPAGPR